jgi:hypothetical protein
MNPSRLLIGACALFAGCALRTPERATSRFIRDLGKGVAQSGGSPAFERVRTDLRLKEDQSKTSHPIYSKSASWKSRKQRIGLASSNVLRDAPNRFDLMLSWSPARTLLPGVLEGLLGTPYGKSATWDNGWIIGGGVLEYRSTETETPYVLFSSPAYIRDPLDFLEASELPHLPSLASVTQYLQGSGSVRSPSRLEGVVESQEFCSPAGVSVMLYSEKGPQKLPYLVGVAISIPDKASVVANSTDFLALLRDLAVPTSDRIVAAAFSAETHSESFAVLNNFALTLRYSGEENSSARSVTLGIWRRIESPRSWCEHLRPDLERCSGALP